MFSWFKKESPPAMLKKDPIGFHLGNWEEVIESCRVAIPKNYANKNYEYVARNSNDALNKILIKHALQLRGKRGMDLAMHELDAAPEFLDYIEDAIAKADAVGYIAEKDEKRGIKPNFILVSNFLFAFPAMFLTRDWARAERIAKAADLPVIQEEGREGESGGEYDQLTKMMIALVLEDHAAFNHQQQRYTRLKVRNHFFNHYFNYDQMMALILARDSVGLNQYLIAQEQNYLSRKNDKKLEQWDMIYGCMEDNDFIYDVWATSLCNLARHRGLDISYSSEVIPSRLFL